MTDRETPMGVTINEYGTIRCPVCGIGLTGNYKARYCPWCGQRISFEVADAKDDKWEDDLR